MCDVRVVSLLLYCCTWWTCHNGLLHLLFASPSSVNTDFYSRAWRGRVCWSVHTISGVRGGEPAEMSHTWGGLPWRSVFLDSVCWGTVWKPEGSVCNSLYLINLVLFAICWKYSTMSVRWRKWEKLFSHAFFPLLSSNVVSLLVFMLHRTR